MKQIMTLGALREWIGEHRLAGMFDDRAVVAVDGELYIFNHYKAMYRPDGRKVEWEATLYCPNFPPAGEDWELVKTLSRDSQDMEFEISTSPSEPPENVIDEI